MPAGGALGEYHRALSPACNGEGLVFMSARDAPLALPPVMALSCRRHAVSAGEAAAAAAARRTRYGRCWFGGMRARATLLCGPPCSSPTLVTNVAQLDARRLTGRRRRFSKTTRLLLHQICSSRRRRGVGVSRLEEQRGAPAMVCWCAYAGIGARSGVIHPPGKDLWSLTVPPQPLGAAVLGLQS